MRKVGQIVAFGIVVATMVALASTDVQAQKKKNANSQKTTQNQPSDAAEMDYKWASYQKGLAGTVLAFDGGQSITLRVSNTHLEPNPKYKPPVLNPNARGYNSQAAMHHHTYTQYRNMHQSYHHNMRNPAQMMQAQMQAQMRMYQQMMQLQMQLVQQQMRMAQQMAIANARANSNPNNQPFKQVTVTKDFTLDLQDKVVYRKTYLPMDYDDQGNPKKYTAAEKTALRGSDKTKPGYTATVEEVQIGAMVNVYLTPPKKQSKSKSKADDDDATATTSTHPTVNMVVLTKEASANASPGQTQPAKKKKKNN